MQSPFQIRCRANPLIPLSIVLNQETQALCSIPKTEYLYAKLYPFLLLSLAGKRGAVQSCCGPFYLAANEFQGVCGGAGTAADLLSFEVSWLLNREVLEGE